MPLLLSFPLTSLFWLLVLGVLVVVVVVLVMGVLVLVPLIFRPLVVLLLVVDDGGDLEVEAIGLTTRGKEDREGGGE